MEISHGRHRLNPHAGGKRIIGPVGKGPALDTFDPNPQPLALACADGVGTANFRAFNLLAKCQILALGEIKRLCPLFWAQGHDNRVTDRIFNIGHDQGMKFCHSNAPKYI